MHTGPQYEDEYTFPPEQQHKWFWDLSIMHAVPFPYVFILGLKNHGKPYMKKSRLQIYQPLEAVKPPLNMPINPSLVNSLFTPWNSVLPKPVRGTFAPAPAPHFAKGSYKPTDPDSSKTNQYYHDPARHQLRLVKQNLGQRAYGASH